VELLEARKHFEEDSAILRIQLSRIESEKANAEQEFRKIWTQLQEQLNQAHIDLTDALGRNRELETTFQELLTKSKAEIEEISRKSQESVFSMKSERLATESSVQAELLTMTAQRDSEKMKASYLEKYSSELKTANEMLQKSLKELESSLREKQVEVHEQELILTRKEMCIQNLTKELENSKAEQIKIQNAMLALKERESCLKQSLESTETKVLFLSERLKACEAEKLVMDSIKAKSSQLHVSIDKLNDKISMLEEEKSTAALRIVELESKLGVSLARLESLRAEKFEADHQAILESQKKDLRIQNLAAQESVYKSQIEELSSRIKMKEIQYDKVVEEYSASREKLAQVVLEAQGLVEKVDGYSLEIARMQKGLESLSEQKTRLEAEMVQLKENNVQKQLEIELKAKEIEKLLLNLSTLNSVLEQQKELYQELERKHRVDFQAYKEFGLAKYNEVIAAMESIERDKVLVEIEYLGLKKRYESALESISELELKVEARQTDHEEQWVGKMYETIKGVEELRSTIAQTVSKPAAMSPEEVTSPRLSRPSSSGKRRKAESRAQSVPSRRTSQSPSQIDSTCETLEETRESSLSIQIPASHV